MKTKLFLFCVLAIMVISTKAQGPTHVNRVYQHSFCNPVFNPILNPFGIQWSKSIVNSSGEHITVAHTNVSGQGENISLTKTDADGAIIFQVDWNSSGINNDYGTGVYEDPATQDIYVCGAADNLGVPPYQAVILKYNPSGGLTFTAAIGPAAMNYIATDLVRHPLTGNLLVAISAEATASGYDYMVAEFNSSNLTYLNANTYNYANLIEVPLGITVDAATGNILLIGGSQSSPTCWAYAEAVFDGTTLSFISAARTNIGGLGGDEPLAYKKDNVSGAIYITGRSWNAVSGKFVIKTVKINTAYAIIWTSTLSLHGMDNAAATIDIDPVAGDIIIGGYATRTDNIKETYCARLSSATGAVIAEYSQASEDGSGDAAIKKLCTNASGDIYFLAGEQGNSGRKQVIVKKVKANGTAVWQQKISDPANDIIPSDIKVTSLGVYVISVLDAATDNYITTKYTELEIDTATVYNSSGAPYYKKNELIVKFSHAALDSAFIDNQIGTAARQFGSLSDFMKPAAFTQLNNTLIELNLCRECDIKAIKIFPDLPTTFTSTTSRLGETVPVPDFWATLLVILPSNLGLQQFCNVLGSTGLAQYAHPNYIGLIPGATITAGPTALGTGLDPQYSQQKSLHDPLFPHTTINAEEAWTVFPEGGHFFIRCGVFDQGLDWSHKDFGYDGINPNISKVKGCWDFWGAGLDLKTVPHGYDTTGHGTGSGGIIGSIRNDTIGIKGICGGNDTMNHHPGISLYGLKIGTSKTHYAHGLGNMQINYLANAITTSAQENIPTVSYDYKLNISNNSWILPSYSWGPPWSPPNLNSDTNIVLLSEAVHFVNRLNVTFVAATGNDSQTKLPDPAGLDDDWVIAVSGTGIDGNAGNAGVNNNFTPNYGKGVDVAAPCNWYTNWSTFPPNTYGSFGGTSAAAPHVSGVAGLLMSYLNDTLNPYQNLAPEDVEQIIQRSASPMPNGSALPNDSVGYGRLNAGKALRLVEKPCNKLLHFGTKYFSHSPYTKNLISVNDTVIITERFHNLITPPNYLPKGKYVLDTWQIDVTVTHGLAGTDTIRGYWPRASMSSVWEKVRNKKLRPHERDTILSCNSSQAQLRGYIYRIKDTTGNVLGWWPFDTSMVIPATASHFEYTILTGSCGIVGIKEENKKLEKLVALFPNPANSVQTIEIETENINSVTIDLYDMMGRQIKNVYYGKTNPGKTRINNDVGNLPNSLYIYIIKINGEVVSKKFIKE